MAKKSSSSRTIQGSGEREIDILQYLPQVVRIVRDFKEIAAAENDELKKMWGYLEDSLNDQFVETATENGLSRWESILTIVPKGTDTLDERRFRILTRLNEQLPYSFRMLCQQLATLCGEEGYSAELKNEEYTLIVKVALTAKSNFKDVDSLLKRIVPANIVIDLTLKYNQHSTLAKFTHRQLATYTHDQLRNEVLK